MLNASMFDEAPLTDSSTDQQASHQTRQILTQDLVTSNREIIH